MPDNPLPYPKGRAYSLDNHYEVWGRKGAGEGPNSPPFLPTLERARVLTFSSAPIQPPREPLPVEEDDDHIVDDWDSQGKTNTWVDEYISTDTQDFDPLATPRTPPSEDGMEGFVLNDAGEYVLAGESLSCPEGTTNLSSPHENDVPSRDLNSSSSSSSNLLFWEPRASVGDSYRGSTRNEGDLGAIRGDLEPSRVTRGQRRFSQDIPVASRGRRRIVLDSSSSENANEPPSRVFGEEANLRGRQDSSTEAQDHSTEAQDSSPEAQDSSTEAQDSSTEAQDSSTEAQDSSTEPQDSSPEAQETSHQNEADEAAEERARRLLIYDGRESQGSDYLPTTVQDERLRDAFMPNFIQVLQAKLQDYIVKVIEPIFQVKVTCFGVVAMCIPILLILRGLMMGYPLMVGMWLGREDRCSSRVAFGSRVFGMLVKGDEYRYDNC
ncbi:hypothetical protein L211DRAFT_867999 [Terfezia boudieri ATCC MYA-4762]|uniref:Uncharacterized protein n=1 Tax=Terfezia boudieri ATCC MYA-4762 TaxID=1051890 RepID=A0A3N4LMU2_9PEZI|nr:hypothetical protein L211DRAFT_867999 [Terfezia boudieri ATCC MYA-4762]